MASVATHIPDMGEAIRQKRLPGAFSADRTAFEFPTLAYHGAGGRRLWTVRVRLIQKGGYAAITPEMLAPGADGVGLVAEISVESLQEHGKVRDVVPTYVRAGKSAGRKNATNPLTQALRDALGLYNKQRRRTGLAATPEGPPPGGVGEAPLQPLPMLLKAYGASREAVLTPEDFREGVTVQRKLNGVHFVVYRAADGRAVAYSRTGALYPLQDPLAAELAAALAAAGPPGPDGFPHLDGELYRHGKSLSWISGQARRAGDKETADLEFHVFDVFFPQGKAAGRDMASRDRQAFLSALFARFAGPETSHLARVENFPAADLGAVQALAAQFVREGYEGAVARKDSAGYRYGAGGYRTPHVLKFKPKHDAEFTVVGFTQGTRGRDVGAVVWVCEVPRPVDPADKTFNVVPKDLTYQERYALYTCLGQAVETPQGASTRFARDIAGLPLTVEYAELSAKTGKPLQAKALAFRTYEGPGPDPLKALLASCAS